MKDIRHLLHVAAAFVVVIIGFLIARHLVVPKSFGRIGHYRADAVDEIKALPLRYAGEQACAPCHRAQAKAKASSRHKGIRCESCHGALQAHAEAPSSLKPAKPKEGEMRAFCARCHEKNLSRPAKFPQVDPREHNPGVACSQCHPPHQPK
ncbi:MAG: cytochrome c3 family protein [Elusimicrobia bacterium]|nr:cytochrome c3 family protein [Elusimicrobiota bacterium]